MCAPAGRHRATVGEIPWLRELVSHCHTGRYTRVSRRPSHSLAFAAAMQNASLPDGVQGPLLDTALAGEMALSRIMPLRWIE